MNVIPLFNVKSVPVSAQAALTELQAQLFREARGSRPVKQLMTWLLDRRNLEAAWDRVQDCDGAATPGPDGVVCGDIRNNLGPWIARLADDLFHRRYRPQPPRWIDIPKPNKPGAFRRLGILTVRDRVVHAALKQVLEPILEPEFLAGSFGFRPGRCVPGALEHALHCLTAAPGQEPPFHYGAQLDVADCFDTIDHTLLRAELARHVADPDVAALVEAILPAGGSRSGALWWQRTCGIVQGSSLSPLLCNLYLHPLDQALADLAQATQNGVRALRYADDLLVLARDARLGERAVALTKQVLRRLQQKLRDPAAPVRPLEEGVEWLGLRLRPRPAQWTGQVRFGYVIPDAKVVTMLERLTEMTTPPSERIDGGAFNLSRWIVSINDQLRDWRQAYVYADNAADVFRCLDDHCRERVAKLLQSITGTRWGQLQRQYRVKLPRGFWTWEVQGTRLSVLSALAPQAPAFLTRKPVWMRHKPLAPAAGERGWGEGVKKAAPKPAPQAIPLPSPQALPALPAPAAKEVS